MRRLRDIVDLQEISKKTLKSYSEKAYEDAERHRHKAMSADEKADSAIEKGKNPAKHEFKANFHYRKSDNRDNGVALADSKLDNGKPKLGAVKEIKAKVLAREEVEQIDEISNKTLASYVKKASSSANAHDHMSDMHRGLAKHREDEHNMQSLKHMWKADDRRAGVEKAKKKLAKEEVEQIDELSNKTLTNYAIKRSAQNSQVRTSVENDISYLENNHDDLYKFPDRAKGILRDAQSRHRLVNKRDKFVKKAVNKLAKEEVEQIEENTDKKFHRFYCNPLEHAESHDDLDSAKKKASSSHYHSFVTDSDHKIVHTTVENPHSQYKVGAQFSGLPAKLREEVEQIDELSKNKLVDYVRHSAMHMGVTKSGEEQRKRYKGILQATRRLKEDSEQIDEANAENKLKKNVHIAKMGANALHINDKEDADTHVSMRTHSSSGGSVAHERARLAGALVRAGRHELKHPSQKETYHAHYDKKQGVYHIKHTESGKIVAHNVANSGGAALQHADNWNKRAKTNS